MSDAFPFLLLVGFFALMWLLFIRPQQRRQRELAHMQGSLEVGDEVMLTSGMYGVLHSIDDDTIQLEVSDDVVLRFARAAVGRVVTETDPGVEDADDLDDSLEDNPEHRPSEDDDVLKEN